MKDDPLVERIRKTRNDISEECGHDPKKLIELYIDYQQQFSDRLIHESKKNSFGQKVK